MEALAVPQSTGHTVKQRQESRFSNQRVHFIGIGGCGMSGLARILLDAGAIVTGSDPKSTAVTRELELRGARISHQQNGELITEETDLVVRTAAVKDDNPEFALARSMGLPHMKYSQLLGEIMQERIGVAVAGTHGKSTTTGMIAYAMTMCGMDPSWVVGGTVGQLGKGSASGSGDVFVVEACEFDRSFHNLLPRIALISNIEADHLDCYRDINDIIESFRHFVSLVPPDGLVICNGQDENVARAVAGATCRVETVAVEAAATWCAKQSGMVNGCYNGEILHNGQPVARIRLSVPGIHNLYNATMAIAACHACGLSPAKAAVALSNFTGVDRRMTILGTYNGATVVDDYGHHPTEIRATLRALRERFNPREIYCAFQPHQYSRTRLLLEQFATCFADADHVLITDIYQCRDSEEDKRAINSQVLVDRIRGNDINALHLAEFSQVLDHLKRNVGKDDLVLTIGAGNICDIGRELVAYSNESQRRNP